MSTEETNGFSAPNEDANVAGADSFESAPAGQAAENNVPHPARMTLPRPRPRARPTT